MRVPKGEQVIRSLLYTLNVAMSFFIMLGASRLDTVDFFALP